MIFDSISKKIQSWHSIHETVTAWKAQEQSIVFTNGCFDILHYGHIHYLAEAKDQGDRLIIGLNSEGSVRRLKGPGRPINDDLTRKHMLAALNMVDAVVVFEQDTPYELIRLIEPDILVKGGDWPPEEMVGADIVLKKGGQVMSLPYVKGYSTTNIEQKIKGDHSS